MNVAPGVNYPDPWWKTFPRATPPVANAGTFAGVPEATGPGNARNEGNSFGPGVGRKPVLPPVQLNGFTFIQNQAGG